MSFTSGGEFFTGLLIIIFLLFWWWYPRKPSLPPEGIYGNTQIRYKNGHIKLVGESGWIPLKTGNHRLTEKGLWLRKKNIFIHRKTKNYSPQVKYTRNIYPNIPFNRR